ncbi:helix-turn-helix domain-containing protein [Streptomyces sp. CB00455]|uniref:helix-turn-helix domain-containing protein n=1 Tax=Streptomyces sp. CB00455 TaxID=1703927 RepID=UPI000B2EA39F|nr:helix-turn-helix domain-containing protein [Streptomyces sp. CB00455]
MIHAFNERGFDALDPKWSGGRPRTIGSQVREHICLVARTSPRLEDHLVLHLEPEQAGRTSGQTAGRSHGQPRDPRRILREGKVSWQTTMTWKSSNDPDSIAKMHRVLALYDTPPADGRVVWVDEFGPLKLQPRKGQAWRPVRSPRRLRATYNRYDGVMHMLTAVGRGLLPAGEHAKGVPSRVSDHQVTEWARAANAGREGTPMLSAVSEDGTTQSGSLINGIVREGDRFGNGHLLQRHETVAA